VIAGWECLHLWYETSLPVGFVLFFPTDLTPKKNIAWLLWRLAAVIGQTYV
jgi:hypothetical protein